MAKIWNNSKWGVYTLASLLVVMGAFVLLGQAGTTEPLTDDEDYKAEDQMIYNQLAQAVVSPEIAQEPSAPVAPAKPSEPAKPAPVAVAKSAPKATESADIVVAQADTKTADPDEPKEYPEAPDFTLKTLEGDEFKFSDNLGKLTILNFWASWCGPCKKEIPSFVKLIDDYKDDGLQIIGVSVDQARSRSKVPGVVKQYKVNYPILMDGAEASMLYGGASSIPTTFIINEDGKVLGRIVGMRPHEWFEQVVKTELGLE